MKVIRIKTPVKLTSGISTPVNTILTVSEAYLCNKDKSTTEIPAQVSTELYLDANSISTKQPINGIADFPNVLKPNLKISEYETKIAETLIIEAIYSQLLPIYTATNLEIISI